MRLVEDFGILPGTVLNRSLPYIIKQRHRLSIFRYLLYLLCYNGYLKIKYNEEVFTCFNVGS